MTTPAAFSDRAFYVSGDATGTANTICYPAEPEFIARIDFTDNPANAETLQIGTITYTFVTDVPTSNNAYDVEIGGGAPATSNNLIEAINDGTGEGTVYGAGTEAHPVVTAYDDFSSDLYIKGASTQAITDSAANVTVEGLGGLVITTTEETHTNWTTTAASSTTVNATLCYVTGISIAHPTAADANGVVNIRDHSGALYASVFVDAGVQMNYPLSVKIPSGVSADADSTLYVNLHYSVLKNQ